MIKSVKHSQKPQQRQGKKITLEFSPNSYSEQFILYPNLFYESTVEDCDIKITNLSGKFKRITFVIEEYKESKSNPIRDYILGKEKQVGK